MFDKYLCKKFNKKEVTVDDISNAISKRYEKIMISIAKVICSPILLLIYVVEKLQNIGSIKVARCKVDEDKEK